MEHWTRMEFRALALAVTIWDVARADDWEQIFKLNHDPTSLNPWKPHAEPPDWPPPTPRWFIAGIVGMVVFFVVAVIAICFCHFRRRRMLMAPQMLVPAPLAPVASGALKYGYPCQQPPFPEPTRSPVAPYPPQQGSYQQQAMPYTQAPLYAGHNGASLQHPAAPSPLRPPDAPPPYSFESNHTK